MELKDLDLDLDTRLLKRERLLDGLRMAFQILGVADPVLPNTSGSKRKFEKAAFQARENLRRLAALISIQHHLEVMHLEFEHDDLGHTSPHTQLNTVMFCVRLQADNSSTPPMQLGFVSYGRLDSVSDSQAGMTCKSMT